MVSEDVTACSEVLSSHALSSTLGLNAWVGRRHPFTLQGAIFERRAGHIRRVTRSGARPRGARAPPPPQSMSDADAQWFPRPRGAAPHGPGGVPKRWNHSTGTWETSAVVEKEPREPRERVDHGPPRLVPRPRGAVRGRPLFYLFALARPTPRPHRFHHSFFSPRAFSRDLLFLHLSLIHI